MLGIICFREINGSNYHYQNNLTYIVGLNGGKRTRKLVVLFHDDSCGVVGGGVGRQRRVAAAIEASSGARCEASGEVA